MELPLIRIASSHRLAAFDDQQYRISGVIQQVIVHSKSFSLAKVTRTVSVRCAILKPDQVTGCLTADVRD